MTVNWPLPANRASNDAGFIPAYNQVEEALNQIMVGTGWRNISSLLISSVTATGIRICRRGPRVHLQFNTLAHSAGANAFILTSGLPTGWRPDKDHWGRFFADGSTLPSYTVLADGRIQMNLAVQSVAAWQEISWLASSATWPTELPGVAA